MKLIWMALDSPRTNFVFTPNSIYHKYSYLFNNTDPIFQLSFVNVGMSIIVTVLLKFAQNCTEIIFMTYLTNRILKKNCETKNYRRQSQFNRKRGGGPRRYDHDHRFNRFFYPSLSPGWGEKKFCQGCKYFGLFQL